VAKTLFFILPTAFGLARRLEVVVLTDWNMQPVLAVGTSRRTGWIKLTEHCAIVSPLDEDCEAENANILQHLHTEG
jgi:hypothetical protein